MKKFVRSIFNCLGLEITKISKIKTQQKSKKTKHLTLHQTATGNYYLPTDAFEDAIANAIINNGIFDKEVVELASNYIRPGTTVLDLGANFGQMSILFSNMAGNDGKIHSFEADDWIYEILTKNIEANGKVGKVIPHFGAVHNKSGETLLFPEQDFDEFGTYGSYGIDYTSRHGRQVQTLTIDELNIEGTISFMKVDVQGGDLYAMEGARETILRNKMPILFEYEYLFEDRFNMCFQDYVDFVQSINYKFHKVINGQNFLIVPK
jgi:FkbM family methyltransferase